MGNPANHWYCVISGAARRCVIRLDGRRQIIDLFLPGDVFGFSASEEYDYTVEAVAEGTVVASYPRRRVEMLADADPLLGREIRQVAFLALARLQAQLLILGRITALEKVGSFILEIATRMSSERGNSVAFANVTLRYRGLSCRVGGDRQSFADVPQTARRDQILGHADRADRRSGCAGRRRTPCACGVERSRDKRPECPSRHS